MNAAKVIALGIMVTMIGYGHSAELLRTPKVYNALITTDQNLTPSRAYPVIQPTIRDSPFLYSPYNFSPYGFYDPFGYNEFGGNAQPLFQRYNVNNNRAQFANNQAMQAAASASASAAAAAAGVASNSVGSDRSFLVNRNPDYRNSIADANDKSSPIPLNEFGLPPSLVPIAPYGNINQNPIDLAPYNYNSYPLIFDQFGGFQQGPYLPHFGNVPQNAYAAFGAVNGNRQQPIGNAAGQNGFSSGEMIGNRQQQPNGEMGNRNVVGLPGTAGGAVQAANEHVTSFNRENINGVNGAAQRSDFAQSSASNGSGGDGQSLGAQSSFQSTVSSSTASSSSSSSSGNDGTNIAQSTGGFRNGRIFYFNDNNIKNNQNRNENIVDAASPLPFGAKNSDEQ